MKNVCACFIGSDETAKMLGNKATVSDLEFLHYKKTDSVLTIVRPIGFPEKIKTLIQAVNMTDYVVVELSAVDKFFGEIIILLDLLGKKGCFIVPLDKQHLVEQVKSFGLDYNFRIINNNDDIKQLKDDLLMIEPVYGNEPLIIIDHFFNIKNVGTVALGFTKGGTIKVKDKFVLLPGGRPAQLNSMQSMDVDYKEINWPARVGVSLKNCDVKDLERGSILSNELKETKELSGEIIKSRFFKGELKKFMVINGLLSRQAELKDKVMLEKTIVLIGPSVIYDDNTSPRIIGIIKQKGAE
ncbi:MAG: hypothetical protein WC307_00510 [Candidatus Nanoarchaeia archaeon]|jgi:selenocysteine-specific translation elongation factor